MSGLASTIPEPQGRSLWVDARRRLLRNRAAMAGIVILATIVLLALLAPLLSPFAYDEVNYDLISCAPGWWPMEAACTAPGHIFGTDAIGRDIFVRSCINCHRKGEKAAPLALTSTVNGPDPRNVIQIVLHGIRPPKGARDFSMPASA